MSTAAIILIVIVVLMALGGGCMLCVCLGAKGISDQKAAEDKKNAESKRNAIRLPIATLLKEYQDNEVRADTQFKGKYVEVSGKVDDVKKDVIDQMYVTVGTGKAFEIPQVQCYFDEKQKARASALSKGKPVTVRGRVEGLLFNVMLKDCGFLIRYRAAEILRRSQRTDLEEGPSTSGGNVCTAPLRRRPGHSIRGSRSSSRTMGTKRTAPRSSFFSAPLTRVHRTSRCGGTSPTGATRIPPSAS
jgi:hypothetical protein